MILLSPLCSNTLQLTGTSAHGTWSASEWVYLWVRWLSTSTPGQGTATHSSPFTLLSMGAKLRCTAEMKPAEWFNWYNIQHMGNHLPRDAKSCLIIKNRQNCTMSISELANVNQKEKPGNAMGVVIVLHFAIQTLEQRWGLWKYFQECFYIFALKQLKSQKNHPHC